MTDLENCPQAWHGGLPFGLLHECKYAPKHRGSHRNEDGSLSWGGKLTPAEHEVAVALRASRAAAA